MSNNIKNIITGIIIIIIVIFTMVIINTGLKRTERAECIKWQGWQVDQRLFTPSASMIDQCNYYDVKLNKLNK